jgi:hypothetical protein
MLAEARDFSLLQKCPDWFWEQPSLLVNGYLCPFLVIKRQGIEVGRSLAFNA